VIEGPAEIGAIHRIVRIELDRSPEGRLGFVEVVGGETNAVVGPGKAGGQGHRALIPLARLRAILCHEKDVGQAHDQDGIVGVGLQGNPKGRLGIPTVVLGQELFAEQGRLSARIRLRVAGKYDASGRIGEHDR